MPRNTRGKQVASDIRGAFVRACRELEDEKKPLSLLMKQHLEADFLGTLRALSSFVPKEMMLQGDDEAPMHMQVSVEFVKANENTDT